MDILAQKYSNCVLWSFMRIYDPDPNLWPNKSCFIFCTDWDIHVTLFSIRFANEKWGGRRLSLDRLWGPLSTIFSSMHKGGSRLSYIKAIGNATFYYAIIAELLYTRPWEELSWTIITFPSTRSYPLPEVLCELYAGFAISPSSSFL